MSFDLKAFGEKLTRCRTHLELEHTEVSAKVGIVVSRLKELEHGLSEPTGDEVLILSDFYLQDYNFFISNEQKSASEQVDILYRKFGNNISKHDRWVIQEFIFLCECEEFVLKGINFERRSFSFSSNNPIHKTQGTEAGIALREFLGFSNDKIIPDIYSELRKIGLHIFRRKLQNSDISSLFINHPYAGKCVLVNYHEDVFRQNFTVSHETGHAIFDFNNIVNVSFEKDGERNYQEIRANAFASAFLVSPTLAPKFRAINWNEQIIRETALRLKVNPIVLAIALKQLKIIDGGSFQSLKAVKIPKAEKMDSELIGVSQKIYDSKKKCFEMGLSSFYIKRCFEAYSKGLISANRMAEMFLTDSIQLSEILGLFNLRTSNEH